MFSTIKFEKHNTKFYCPYVIYGDFECLTTKSKQNKGLKGSYKNTSYCLMLSFHLIKLRLHRQICWNLKQSKSGIVKKMKEVKPMEISPEQEQEFQLSTCCSICNQHFKEDNEKVRDSCHFIVKYRGAVRAKCNLDYSVRYFKIPVLFPQLEELRRTFDTKQGWWNEWAFE